MTLVTWFLALLPDVWAEVINGTRGKLLRLRQTVAMSSIYGE